MGFTRPEGASMLMYANIGGALGGIFLGLLTLRFDVKKLTIATLTLSGIFFIYRGRSPDIPETEETVGIISMPGILNDFTRHVRSGLSGFILNSYDACDHVQTSTLLVRLLPAMEVPEPFAGNPKPADCLQGLRDKFAAILEAQSRMALDEIASLEIKTDFAPDKSRVRKRRRMMAAIPVYYGCNAA
jgi:hypothetical protein